jgi:hypothetical protein
VASFRLSLYIAMKTKQSLCSLKDLWGVRVPLRVGVLKWLSGIVF